MKTFSPTFRDTSGRVAALLGMGLSFLSPSLAAQQSRWSGALNGDWNQAGNWSNGIPTTSANPVFGAAAERQIVLAPGVPAINRLAFDPYAPGYTFSGSGLALGGSNPEIAVGFGASAQTFNVALEFGGAGRLRNDSLSGALTLHGAINPVTARTLRLRGLGEGVLTGATRVRLDTVSGGGTWTFSGANLAEASGNSTWSGGTRVILDYRDSLEAKWTLPINFYLRGAAVEAIGAASGTTTVHLASSKIIPGASSFADGYGFASRFHGTSTGEGEVVFEFGGQFVDATNTQAYVHFGGDATFSATSLRSSGSVAHAVWVYRDQYAAFDSESGTIGARSLTSVNAQSGAITSGTSYYETTLSAGTTTRAAAVTAKGLRLLSTGEAVWEVNAQFLPSSSVGTSLLFAGQEDVTIRANGFGGGQAHWIHQGGDDALLTLDGPLAAGADHRKAGAGTILLLNTLEREVAASVQALHIGEGTLRLGYSQVMGSAPSGNGIYVQSGASVALQGNISLQAGTTTYLHGLGDRGEGALRNHDGTNRLAGTVMFGTTASIVSAAGELELAGLLDALEGEPVTVLFDGAGVTRVSGDLSANLTGGLYKTGSGTVILEGTSHSAGRTEVQEGAFLLHGGALSGDLAVRDGAIFGGVGELEGATLLDEGSTLRLELRGAGDDYLLSAQSFTLGDDVELDISLHQAALLGETFRLVSEQAEVTGTFALVNGGAFLPGSAFTLEYGDFRYTLGLSYGAGISATVLDVAVVPEPGTWGLLGIGVLSCWWRQRRRSLRPGGSN